MIINKQRNVILYNMPRTGTLSLATAARNARSNANVRLDYITEGHTNYSDLKTILQRGDWKDYNKEMANTVHLTRSAYENNKQPITTVAELDAFESYVFVREPLARAKSAVNLLRRGRLHHCLLNIVYGHRYRIPCTQRDDDYDNFPQWKKDAINAIPYIEAFRHLKWWFTNNSLLMGHMGFIEGPVQPLMFDNFTTDARMVLGKLGVPQNIPIPHENSAKYIEEYDGLSPTEEQEIKDFFAEDYEYLDSKGITFP